MIDNEAEPANHEEAVAFIKAVAPIQIDENFFTSVNRLRVTVNALLLIAKATAASKE